MIVRQRECDARIGKLIAERTEIFLQPAASAHQSPLAVELAGDVLDVAQTADLLGIELRGEGLGSGITGRRFQRKVHGLSLLLVWAIGRAAAGSS